MLKGYQYKLKIDIYIIEKNNKIYALTTNDKYEYTVLIKEATRQLNEYFNGERKVFDLPLDLTETSFQTKVWQELLKISYGEMKSYKDVDNK